ncbi:MAG: glycosyltransferase family 39 protein [Dehalococcoidia bacterium]|nr:glycosyltransferase family 39 protein [Dehalococcoidia bacterium]
MAKKTTFLAALMALLAFVLRMARLDYVSLRGDEAFSVMVSRWDFGRLFDLLATTEPHPPLYYTLLHFWIRIAGDGEIAVRFPSVAFGVLLVPATFSFGRILIRRLAGYQGGRETDVKVFDKAIGYPIASVGLLAAFFVAINPFLLWYSQDARSYIMLACLTTASMALSLRDLSKAWKWCVFVVVTYAAMLTHYTAIYVVLTENIVVLLLLLLHRQDRLARARRWFSAQALLVVAYLPWVWWAISPIRSHSVTWIDQVDFSTVLERTLVTVGAGTTIDAESRSAVLMVVVLVLLFALMGLARFVRTSARWTFVVSGLYLMAPAVLLYGLSLWRPMFDERHLVIFVSSFALLAALGAVSLVAWRWVGVTLSVVLLGSVAFLSMVNYYFDPEFAKSPGWRELVNEIRTQEKSGDYILLNFPDPIFSYYYRGSTPIGLLPANMPVDRAGTERSLADLSNTYRRIWTIPGSWWDTDRIVQKWLGSHLRKVREESFRGVGLELFSTQ